ncbi:MAG: tRNA (adenosine(37)-N6)-threonylcarbamoyltransferase complex dimerization subunit type 1 TsaB [Flammeovirgaceae bacterium]
MALILSLETATSCCSVALHKNGALLIHYESPTAQSTASQLAVMIDQAFKSNQYPMSELVAVAISAGPGSYTGLRIGTATAKGICYALSIPLIAINTLELMVEQFLIEHTINSNALCCPMLDARRMEVYSLLMTPQKKIVEKTESKVIDNASFADQLAQQEIYFFGDGASKCEEVIQHPNAHFINNIHPVAKHMGMQAFYKFSNKQFEDTVTFEPLYLKDFMIRKPTTTN